ncbi:MAG TPA: peptidyl-prolyl cis-trans isomerase [Vicinamibacterales bacterium]|nr:peptidyl-prolyl cis-trans isomerase [Vicinamibacterales bacterium]
MTMLDQMRRHKGWLKWSLGLVVLAFVIFYIPDFLRQDGAGAVAGDTVATIEGREITAADFRRTYDVQLQAYRNAYGGNISEQLLKQLGIDQQILAQLVDQQVALVEAERLGIAASDEEVRQRIFATPAFQENGAFIGEQRYQQLLRSQRPPMTPATFESAVRDEIVVDKLHALLTDWLSITDAEVEREYRVRNDKVKLAVIPFMAESFRAAATASDEEIGAYFNAHQAEFLIPEKRKVRFVSIDLEAIRAKVTVPEANVERAYNENIAQYSTPEQVRASHILLRIEGKDEAAVKAKADDLVKQARAGADFAALARANSEDEGSAKNGGDLDFFGRGRMVPEFDQVVFTMEPGQVSEPVKTQFGFHVIKLVDKKPGTMRPLAEVRQQLVDQLAYETAQAQAGDLAQTMAAEITRPEDLDRAAARHGLTVQESGFFARDEQILTLGSSPEAVARAFELQQGQVSGALRSARGLAFLTVTAIQPPTMPGLDEAKDRVREAVLKQKTQELSRQKATEVAARLKGAADFDRAATAAGVTSKTTELITRDSPISDLGLAPTVTDAAFALPVGALSDPIATDTGTALVKVIEKQEVTPAEWASNRDMFRNELLADKRNRFFASYMTKAKQKMTIQLNRETIQRALL